MTEIVIYVEGGGDSAQQRSELRQGFDSLLGGVKSKAREKRLGWKLVLAGGRQATYEAFLNALTTGPGSARTVLLVDAEAPVAATSGDLARDAMARVAHLVQRDKWDLSAVQPERVHLMVQCMEAWIVADARALEAFYQQGFIAKALPARDNLEDEPKKSLYNKLAKATRASQKGEYGKIRHASQLLQRIDPAIVARRCPRFGTLIHWLETAIADL